VKCNDLIMKLNSHQWQ